MFEAKRMMFIYTETPLHAGTGRGLGAVDLPIQRERTTGYPMVQASSLKGRLRAEMRERNGWKDDDPHLTVLFGKAGDAGENWAGAIAPGDARILLFPVRSLAGVFAWTTSIDALARFGRVATLAGLELNWELPDTPLANNKAWVTGNTLQAGDSVVLEEFSFTPDRTQASLVQTLGNWLVEKALPGDKEYAYWRAALPKKLCILPEDAFRDFVRYGTEIQTHIALNPDTKTVDKESGALWTTESLPIDTLLYAPLLATKPHVEDVDLENGEAVLQQIADLNIKRTQLGGDETTGQGIVALTFAGGEE